MEIIKNHLGKISVFFAKLNFKGLVVFLAALILLLAVGSFYWFKVINSDNEKWKYPYDKKINYVQPGDEINNAYLRGYRKEKGKIYLNDKIVEGADYKSFDILPIAGFAMDKDNIFLGGKKVEGLDYPTFSFIGNMDDSSNTSDYSMYPRGYFKDQNSVYYFNFDYNYNISSTNSNFLYNVKKLTDADPGTFVIINGYYAKDNKHLYYYDQIVGGVDINTFTFLTDEESGKLNYYYGKDNLYAYYINKGEFKIIENVDGPSFKMISVGEYHQYPADKNYVYLNEGSLKLAITNFVGFSCSYLKDDKKVYYYPDGYWQELAGADSGTFRELSHCYMADKSYLYKQYMYRFAKQAGVDFNSFEVVESKERADSDYMNDFYSKDKYVYYYQGNKIENSDVLTFQIADGFTKDKNNVYYLGKKVSGADPLTFERTKDGFKDKDSIFVATGYGYETILGYDNETFGNIKFLGNYVVGKQKVYYDDRITTDGLFFVISGADRDTFEVPGFNEGDKYRYSGYAKDKNYVYQAGKVVPGADPFTFFNKYYKD